MKVVGFTGTRRGMTPAQRSAVDDLLRELMPISEVHHGMCVGADDDFDCLAWLLRLRRIGHPGVDARGEATNRGGMRGLDVVLPERPYLTRDVHIVEESDVLIAAPDGPERRRSGTWATVRAARRRLVPYAVVYPEGLVDLWSP